jgi:hypothetical protein
VLSTFFLAAANYANYDDYKELATVGNEAATHRLLNVYKSKIYIGPAAIIAFSYIGAAISLAGALTSNDDKKESQLGWASIALEAVAVTIQTRLTYYVMRQRARIIDEFSVGEIEGMDARDAVGEVAGAQGRNAMEMEPLLGRENEDVPAGERDEVHFRQYERIDSPPNEQGQDDEGENNPDDHGAHNVWPLGLRNRIRAGEPAAGEDSDSSNSD